MSARANAARYLREHARLVAPEQGYELSVCGIGPHSEAVAIWQHGNQAIATTHDPGLMHSVRFAIDMPLIRSVQPLSGGRYVVVGWSESEQDLAVVVSPDGEVASRANVGIATSELHTSAADAVWVGYSDVGVYSAGPSSDISGYGLARFDSDLHLEWIKPSGSGLIDNCESLNLVNETVWTSPYVDHPVMRIRDDTVETWLTRKEGSNVAATLVDEAETLVAQIDHPWSSRPGQVWLATLASNSFEPHRSGQIRLPDGSALPEDALLVGRGHELHVLDEHSWWRLNLEELMPKHTGSPPR